MAVPLRAIKVVPVRPRRWNGSFNGRGGSITHIASVEASLPAPTHAHYAASKAGVKMHARAAALE